MENEQLHMSGASEVGWTNSAHDGIVQPSSPALPDQLYEETPNSARNSIKDEIPKKPRRKKIVKSTTEKRAVPNDSLFADEGTPGNSTFIAEELIDPTGQLTYEDNIALGVTAEGLNDLETATFEKAKAKLAPPEEDETSDLPIFKRYPYRAIYDPRLIQVFSTTPELINCPYCKRDVLTTLRSEVGPGTLLSCCILVLGACFGCCIIPFFVRELKDIFHDCPSCKKTIGVRMPFPEMRPKVEDDFYQEYYEHT